jgi:hypothetical protein
MVRFGLRLTDSPEQDFVALRDPAPLGKRHRLPDFALISMQKLSGDSGEKPLWEGEESSLSY